MDSRLDEERRGSKGKTEPHRLEILFVLGRNKWDVQYDQSLVSPWAGRVRRPSCIAQHDKARAPGPDAAGGLASLWRERTFFM
jgi:hypothetical protein